MHDTPLLELSKVSRLYSSGETVVRALDEVSLRVWPGEFVAIMGPSGSGKSTLMNLIGCLDRPTSGSYKIGGEEVSDFASDGLAELRREIFGFVFQRYNLLNTATAEENVEMPAIYAGVPRAERLNRVRGLLDRLGLADRASHLPSALSGGQQQRVAIARALVNDPWVILADEPTGALDSTSGEEVMDLLGKLHSEGRTIILITHEPKVASHAGRIINVHDGRIVDDSIHSCQPRKTGQISPREGQRKARDLTSQTLESAKTALRALSFNLFRTALTLLGIVIGVASVVTMLAVGDGSKQKVLDEISAMGTNLLSVRPGAAGIRSSGEIARLRLPDAEALAELPNVQLVVPERSGRMTVRYSSVDYSTTIYSVGSSYPLARDWPVAVGSFFNDRDMSSYAAVAVLGRTVADILFPNDPDPAGNYVLMRNVPFEVIGIMSEKGASSWGGDQDDAIFIPISTGLVKLFGQSHLSGITLKVSDLSQIDATEAEVTNLLKQRHGMEDFRVRNTASIIEAASETQNTLTILLGAVAAISLLVGGIGIMNIMLVSVTERTREIGIRMATGARMRDVLLQFNTEAAIVGLFGGILGVLVGFLAGWCASLFGITIVFSPAPPVFAFVCAVATGLLFGYLPARKAARLDPIVALSAE
jgi:macrolide transport system ATP-binding/permease protein